MANKFKKNQKPNPIYKNILLMSLAFFAAFAMFQATENSKNVKKVSYSEFLDEVENGDLGYVKIQGNDLEGRKTKDSKEVFTTIAAPDPDLVATLRENNSDINVEKTGGTLSYILVQILPFLIILAFLGFLMNRKGGAGGALSFGKNKAKKLDPNEIKVSFKDVAGLDEPKEELSEVVNFLKNKSKYIALGAKIPKGILLLGSPGTGKTLLAKAVAGESKVPFLYLSGADFVEMFVGVGASRVRDLFETANKLAPCIVFIDEIDAVGRHRGAGFGGGNDEREQTLNQLLIEMDGFKDNSGIIIIAASNRPDVLDPALTRPGRFDRQVIVPLPDAKGREQILKVHIKNIIYSKGIDIKDLAKGTPGFSGADLANLVNEAALNAAKNDKKIVKIEDFEAAKDKILMGLERKTAIITPELKKTIAYHEAGHAVVTKYISGETDPLHKVTIIPRGRALGVTMSLPDEDRFLQEKGYIENQIAILMGGRLAEELILNQKTTGASNDIERATKLAKNMVCSWGMSDLGPLNYASDNHEVFLGKEYGHTQTMSESVAAKVDAQITKIVTAQYERAKDIIQKHITQLHNLANALLEHETIEKFNLDNAFEGKSLDVKVISEDVDIIINPNKPKKSESKITADEKKSQEVEKDKKPKVKKESDEVTDELPTKA